MLQELRDPGTPGLLIITDSALHSGREILLSFLLAALRSLTFHDGFSDPLNWRKSSQSFTLEEFSVKGIWQRVGSPTGAVTIILDSLSWILSRCPLASVCHTLRDLPRHRTQDGPQDVHVLALLHSDLHVPGVLQSVCLLADSVINVTDSGRSQKATIVHRKKSGRVVTHVEHIRVCDDFSLETVNEGEREPEHRPKVDTTVNLTFNPRLSESERDLKESSILPYTFSDNKKLSLLQSAAGSAKIYYDPDPTDDLDDEDPDDDLDV
ncbi:elongator complex protein 5 isoform X2 [Pseudophryne corroboree]|uniref:elongator complex protein 5 isoform X2 n=1 Tax=Pseudophryne corroboree TaxID=495146 RepID=UPI00308126DA